MKDEYAFVIIKPDGVKQGIINEIIERIHALGFSIVNYGSFYLTVEYLQEHYKHITHLPFYKSMEQYLLSDKVLILQVFGENVNQDLREIVGQLKDPLLGTIRFDYGDKNIEYKNVIHVSDTFAKATSEWEVFQKHMGPILEAKAKLR
jgi:nucleoside-diphosphate kinase